MFACRSSQNASLSSLGKTWPVRIGITDFCCKLLPRRYCATSNRMFALLKGCSFWKSEPPGKSMPTVKGKN
jgi:hypothetical protein